MDVVDARPVLMMRRAVVVVPRRAVVMPRRAVVVPRIGSNVYRMMRSMLACAMDARSRLVMPPPGFAVCPSTGCNKEKSNGCY